VIGDSGDIVGIDWSHEWSELTGEPPG
jgi:hypothetical protein